MARNPFGTPSLVVRVGVGKAVGAVFGLVALIALPYFAPEAGWLLRIGLLLWYATLGAVIGVFGVFDRHPVLKMPMPWWLRAPAIGACMNFVLTFFAYDVMAGMLIAGFGVGSLWTSPWWFTLKGAVVGLAIDYCATRLGGEGRATVTGRDTT